MKKYRIIPFMALAAVTLGSCDDEKMEWYTPDGHGQISTSDIPLDLAEKLANYDSILAYVPQGFNFGLGLDVDMYLNTEEYPQYKALANANFNNFTCGNAMKQDAILNAKGELNFTKVDNFFAAIPADKTVYGHVLVWHSQQNVGYINSLVADSIVKKGMGPTNIITNGSFEDAWSATGSAIEDSGAKDGTKILQVTNAKAGSEWDTQVAFKFNEELQAGCDYDISLWVKSNADGQFRLSTNSNTTLGDSWKYCNYMMDPSKTSTVWKEYKCRMTAKTDGEGAYETQLGLDFGKVEGVYYVDNVVVEPVISIVKNPSFEYGITDWTLNGSPDKTVEASGAKHGTQCITVSPIIANLDNAAQYKTQLQAKLTTPMEKDSIYDVSVWVKSDAAGGKFRISTNSDASSNGWKYSYYGGDQETTTEWTEYTCEITAKGGDGGADGKNIKNIEINMDLGYEANEGKKFYIDRFYVTPRVTGGNVSYDTIVKPDSEKKAKVSKALEKYVKGMIDHCKSRVPAWDVLNEAITDDCSIRGLGAATNETAVYYAAYMGKEYAVKAFQWAREADADAKLFINDYNLETNPSKLAALIEYVNYIDQENGAPIVDGIGTQMHLDYKIDTLQIDAMFKTLAATGKLIRVTELDVKLGTNAPSATQMAEQAAVYQYVIKSYFANIPEAQRYGITIWSLTDMADEHKYWLTDESPNLFDASYGRKHAYKGVCDGLAGRDVSEDFTGDDYLKIYE